MYVLEVKDLLRPVRNSSHEEFEWNQRRASCKEISGKLQVMDEWLRMPLWSLQKQRENQSILSVLSFQVVVLQFCKAEQLFMGTASWQQP